MSAFSPSVENEKSISDGRQIKKQKQGGGKAGQHGLNDFKIFFLALFPQKK